MDDQITVNVGGKKFTTRRGTLVGRSKYFAAMFGGAFRLPEETDLIDRCPKLFKHVLRLLRDPNYEFPPQHHNELDFYHIEYEKVEISPPTPPRPPLTIRDWSLPNFPVRLGETHVQMGDLVLPHREFVGALVLAGQHGTFSLFLVQSEKSSSWALVPAGPLDDLLASIRFVFEHLDGETRSVRSRDTRYANGAGPLNHAFYIPSRVHPRRFTATGFVLNEEYTAEDAEFYATWCLNQRAQE